MNREIKFRGKSYFFDGRWIFGDLYRTNLDGGMAIQYYDEVDGWMTEDIDENTVGQYTGLHDKNEKEIYEGDILLWHTMYLSVEWRQEDCRYVLVGCHDNGYVLNAYKCNIEDDFEVISNIHENPKLLEGGEK